MRALIGIALLLSLSACDNAVDTLNANRGPVEVENGTSAVLQRLFHPRCGDASDGPDRLEGHADLQPGDVLEIDMPSAECYDFKADFSDNRRRVITRVTPDADQRQRITFR
jgi:hypothetical protein